MRKSPSPYIHHILDAATHIAEFIEDMDRSSFGNEIKTQYAVVHLLEVIGEACTNLEDNFKQSHPSIPWKQIVAMRNKLAHQYWDIDLDIVWYAVTHEVPELKKQMLDLLSKVGE